MTKQNNKILQSILVALILVIPMINALTISPLGSHVIEENKTINLDILVSNYSGNVTFSIDQPIGELIKVNNSKATFEWIPGFSDAGSYDITFTAIDDTESQSEIATITVTNTNSPVQIIDKSDIVLTYNKKVQLAVTTDKEATCKYSFNNIGYDSMEYTFLSKNAEKTEHEGETPTLAQDDYTLYMLCEDEYGDVMTTPETLSFEVNLKPTARISLNPDPPLRTERVKISVTTSEELIDDPEIKYFFDDDLTQNQVTLVGSGTSWYGYLIIRTSEKQRIGSFTFKGTDMTNLVGNEITSGEIFIVDDENPEEIQGIKVQNRDRDVKVVWIYRDEDKDYIQEYNVYKKIGSGGTDYTDYLTTVDEDYYVDDDVEYNEAYYYRVAAVDEAGNEGPLSKEVFITHTPILDEDEEEILDEKKDNKLDEKLAFQLDLENNIIEKILLDIEEVEKSIGRIKGKDRIEAIETLGIVSEINAQKAIVTNLQAGLLELKNQDLSETEFKTRTTAILEQVMEAWKNTPNDVIITESSTYEELSDDQKTMEIISKLMDIYNIELENAQKSTMIEDNKKLQDQITVEATITKADKIFPERTEQAIIIKKVIKAKEPIQNVQIIEMIPDSIGEAEIIKFTEEPSIIEKNHIVSWTRDELTTETIKYYAIIDVNIAEAKLAKTVIAIDNLKELKGNVITGLVSSSEETKGGKLFIPLIAGILIASLLTFYYFYSSEEKEADKKGRVEKGLTAIKSKFKKLNRRIILKKDDSHKKINIENEQVTEGPKEIRQMKSKQIQEIQNEVDNENLTLSQLRDIKSQTNQMKSVLDDIDKRNMEQYTENAKRTLGEALQFMLESDKLSEKDNKLLNKLVPEDKAFLLKNGIKLRSLRDLKNCLEHIDDETFRFHVRHEKNDFANWVRDVFEEYELAHKVRSAFTKEETKKTLEI